MFDDIFVDIFEQVDNLKNQIDACRALTTGEKERFDREFLVEFTHNSNAIEGNTLTLRETAYVFDGITIDQKPLKDHMEAIGHRDAYYFVLDMVAKKQEFDQFVVDKIHSLVLIDRPQDRGVYRKYSVAISGSSHQPPQPYLIPKLIEDLMIHQKEWRETKHIAEQIALFHLKFESIHPYIDGNGRTGRLLNNLKLLQQGYLPINIKFADRKKYYDAFEDYHKTKKHTVMTQLIAQAMIESMQRYIQKIGDSINI